jgi:hypothetical protein
MEEIGMPLQISLNGSRSLLLLSTQHRQAYSRYKMIGFQLSAIYSGASWKWISHIFSVLKGLSGEM